MSGLGASRFTALLAAIAISGMAGAFWWAFETRTDMQRDAAARHGTSRSIPAKFKGRARPNEQIGKIEPKFELMGKSGSQPGSTSLLSSVRTDEQELALTPSPVSPNPVSSSPAPSFSLLPRPISTGQGPTGTSLPNTGLGSLGPASQGPANPVAPNSRANMPLPALPAFAAQPDPVPPSWQVKEPDPPIFLPRLPATAPQPAENQKRPTREAARHTPAAAPGPRAAPKPPAPSYYMEKYLDQGEYHLRRRPCEPPNMPDVCFMPQADRQPVLARP
jgi:hypothetical protein